MSQESKVLDATGLNVWYGDFRALRDVDIAVNEHRVTALIGPSGMR